MKMKKTVRPCPESPNCVSSQSTDPSKWMAPLRFKGQAPTVRAEILTLLERMPRVRVVEAEDDYIHAEFTTLLFRFVDDVELVIDSDEKLVHFRSASRVGSSDLGTNRRRMAKLCRRLEPGL